ncbi:hypothetical protein [Neosynechococcus sphagnicola]|uniref:hypothetical protein n=1 Tax=Neosynechococcus sphagnicola TaxID=1501145 RepID=UPI00069196D3|nr:hypothetical protein [Neosynechococcus sphagnicola]
MSVGSRAAKGSPHLSLRPEGSPRSRNVPIAASGSRNIRYSQRQALPGLASPTIEILPNGSRPLPLGLRLLGEIQQGSTMGLLLIVIAVLGVYGWSVYSQRLWSQQFEHLQTLQRQERQLTAANEALKNQMAEMALRPSAGLIPPSPTKTIFLKPLPTRPLQRIVPGKDTSIASTPPMAY